MIAVSIRGVSGGVDGLTNAIKLACPWVLSRVTNAMEEIMALAVVLWIGLFGAIEAGALPQHVEASQEG